MLLPSWCQAANCTLVTSNLWLLDKRSRSWLQRSYAQLRGVTRTMIKRRGFVKKYGSAAVEDSTVDVFFEKHCGWYGLSICFMNSFLLFNALIVLIIGCSCDRVTACDSHQLSLAGWLQVVRLPALASKMMPLPWIHH